MDILANRNTAMPLDARKFLSITTKDVNMSLYPEQIFQNLEMEEVLQKLREKQAGIKLGSCKKDGHLANNMSVSERAYYQSRF